MALPTTLTNVTTRKLGSTLNNLWAKTKDTFSPKTHTHSVKINGNTKTIAATDGTAVDLGTYLTGHQTIKQDGVTGATVNRFGTCSTAAGTAAKTVSITTGTYSLEAGATVAVKFSNKNTANNPTLAVGSTAAKNIFVNGAQITTNAGQKGLLAGTVLFIYDGTQYHLIGNYYDSNSTGYSPQFTLGATSNTLYYTNFASMAIANESGNGEAQIIYAAGTNYGATDQGTWLITISNRGSTASTPKATMTVRCLNKYSSGASVPEFGYFYDTANSLIYFGIKGPTYRGNGTITVLSNSGATLKDFGDGTTAPTGWTPVTVTEYSLTTHNHDATYFKSSGNVTLSSGSATTIGTQNGTDVKLTLPTIPAAANNGALKIGLNGGTATNKFTANQSGDSTLTFATGSTAGTIKVDSTEIAVAGFSNKADKASVTAATKCKITYNAQGIVTAGADLAASDIPNLPESKITTKYDKLFASQGESVAGRYVHVCTVRQTGDNYGVAVLLLSNRFWNYQHDCTDIITISLADSGGQNTSGTVYVKRVNLARSEANVQYFYVVSHPATKDISVDLWKYSGAGNSTGDLSVKLLNLSRATNTWGTTVQSTKPDAAVYVPIGGIIRNTDCSQVTDANNARPALPLTDTGLAGDYYIGTTASNTPNSSYNFHIHATIFKNSSGYRITQIAVASASSPVGIMYIRSGAYDGTTWSWGNWKTVLVSSDITTGSANGTIAVAGTDVAVKGLGAAAYKGIDTSMSSSSTNPVQNKTVNDAINLRGNRTSNLWGIKVSKALTANWYDNYGVSIMSTYGGAVHRYDIGFRLIAGTSSAPFGSGSYVFITRSGDASNYLRSFEVWYRVVDSTTLEIMVFTGANIRGVVTYDTSFSTSTVTILTSSPSTDGWTQQTSTSIVKVTTLSPDTHYTTHLYAGASGTAANAATTNGNTYLIAADNSTVRNNIKVVGSGTTSVSSDANGVITITSSDSKTGTVTSVATGVGLTGGTITSTGTIKANLKSETSGSIAAADKGSTANREYAVGLDSNSKLSVNIPWENTHYASSTITGASATATANAAVTGTTGVFLNHIENSAVTSSHKIIGSGTTTVKCDANGVITINSADSKTGTVTSVATGVGLTGGSITTTGTIKANLASETASSLTAAAKGETANREYAVGIDANNKLSVNIPWTNTHYASSTITGASATATANAAVTGNAGVFLNHIENSAVKSSHKIVGSGTTTVNCDANGVITISSADSKTGTVTSVTTGAGLTGGTITSTGTIKANLKSETASSLTAADKGSTSSREYAVGLDVNSNLSVNIPWTDTKVTQKLISTDGSYPVILKNSTTATDSPTSTVNYGASITANPNNGQLHATTFDVNSKCTIQFNTTTNALDFVFA